MSGHCDLDEYTCQAFTVLASMTCRRVRITWARRFTIFGPQQLHPATAFSCCGSLAIPALGDCEYDLYATDLTTGPL